MKLKTLLFLLLAAVGLFGKTILAAEAPLTWQDCLKTTLEHNLELQAATAAYKQSEALFTIASSAWYPQLRLQGTLNQDLTPEALGPATYSASVSATQTLFDGLATPAGVGKAGAELAFAKQQFVQTKADICFALREAYLGVLKSSALESIALKILERREQNLGLVKLRYAGGREHRGSLLLAEADLAQAEFELRQAKRERSLAAEKLSRIMGQPEKSVDVQGQLSGGAAAPQAPDFAKEALALPGVLQKKALLESNRWALQAAYGVVMPHFSARATATLLDSAEGTPEARSSAGVDISLPLFAGGAYWASIRQAELRLEQAKSEYANSLLSSHTALQTAWNNVQNAQESAAVQQKYLEAAQVRAKIASAKYTSGLLGFEDWAAIEDRLVGFQKSHINALAEAQLSQARWIQTRGGDEKAYD